MDLFSDADPNGDYCFVLGSSDAPKSMLVSSKVLSVASPVFAAMFDPKYDEANRPSTYGAPQIPLPDDDTVSFRDLKVAFPCYKMIFGPKICAYWPVSNIIRLH